MTDNLIWILLIAVLVGFVILRSRGSVSADKARELLKAGGLVIDVRSPGEFAQQRIGKAINIPLQQLESRIGKVAPSKETPLLCHCASGARSASAVATLKRLGYVNAVNLGGLGRARSVVEG